VGWICQSDLVDRRNASRATGCRRRTPDACAVHRCCQGSGTRASAYLLRAWCPDHGDHRLRLGPTGMEDDLRDADVGRCRTIGSRLRKIRVIHRPFQWTSRSTQRAWPTCQGVWGRVHAKAGSRGEASGQRKTCRGHHNGSTCTALDSNPKSEPRTQIKSGPSKNCRKQFDNSCGWDYFPILLSPMARWIIAVPPSGGASFQEHWCPMNKTLQRTSIAAAALACTLGASAPANAVFVARICNDLGCTGGDDVIVQDNSGGDSA